MNTNKTYVPGEIVYWKGLLGDWMKGVVREDRGSLVLVDRTSPVFASKLMLRKVADEYQLPALTAASVEDQIV